MSPQPKSNDRAADLAAQAPATTGDVPRDHTDADAPLTDRSTANLGVPMLPGSPSEPVGPEDALGAGEKRGDYRERNVNDTLHFEGQVIPEDEREPDGPRTRLVPQNQRAEHIGDAEGLKGGVDTATA